MTSAYIQCSVILGLLISLPRLIFLFIDEFVFLLEDGRAGAFTTDATLASIINGDINDHVPVLFSFNNNVHNRTSVAFWKLHPLFFIIDIVLHTNMEVTGHYFSFVWNSGMSFCFIVILLLNSFNLLGSFVSLGVVLCMGSLLLLSFIYWFFLTRLELSLACWLL